MVDDRLAGLARLAQTQAEVVVGAVFRGVVPDGFAEGSHGGTGIALYKHWLYAEVNDRIIRYEMKGGEAAPTGRAETILSGMPINGDHPMHPFAIDADGKQPL